KWRTSPLTRALREGDFFGGSMDTRPPGGLYWLIPIRTARRVPPQQGKPVSAKTERRIKIRSAALTRIGSPGSKMCGQFYHYQPLPVSPTPSDRQTARISASAQMAMLREI